MQIQIEIPEKYIKEFNKIIKDKDIKSYLEDHIESVLNVTCPNAKDSFWKKYFTWLA